MPDTIPEINYTLDPSDTIPAPVDPSLSIEGMAADAHATGEALAKKLTTYGELDPLDAPQGTDEVPVGRNDAGYKTDLATLAAALKTLGGYVSKTGDTMTGNLVIDGPLIHLQKKSQLIDVSTNPTSDLYNYCAVMVDKNGKAIGQIDTVQTSDGTTALRLFVYNYDTSGNQTTQGGIYILANRSGQVSYSISNSDNFRDAISASSIIYRDYSFSETIEAGSQLHKRIDSDGIAISGYTIIGTHVKLTSTNILACNVTANTYNDGQLFVHILNQGTASAITGTVRVAYVKNT